MKRVYENEKIRVIWDSDKCIHVANCTSGLPEVFNLNRRPWIDINAADVEEIKHAIDACPSGALSYEIPGQPESDIVTIKVLKNGPYKVSGNCRLIKANGEAAETGKVFALCRCGASKKMPFCDGTHVRIGFQDAN
jgi:uncharacterized Fe-S cluster protein YjdI